MLTARPFSTLATSYGLRMVAVPTWPRNRGLHPRRCRGCQMLAAQPCGCPLSTFAAAAGLGQLGAPLDGARTLRQRDLTGWNTRCTPWPLTPYAISESFQMRGRHRSHVAAVAQRFHLCSPLHTYKSTQKRLYKQARRSLATQSGLHIRSQNAHH